MKKYIVLDSNIFVSFLETGFRVGTQTGDYNEPEDLNVLKGLQKALNLNKVELLLPEVILLELKRIKQEKEEELKKMYEGAVLEVRNFTSTTGKKIAESALSKIQVNMETLCEEEKKKNNETWELLNQIFKHKNTKTLPLNEQILLTAYKRGITGKKPFVMGYLSRGLEFKKNDLPFHDIQPDCIIIENIINFLSDKTNFDLYLGTDDGGFYTSIEKKELDPGIKKELKVKFFSRKLSKLLKEAIGLKTTVKPKAKNGEQTTYPVVGKSSTEEGEIADSMDVADVVKG